MKHFLQTIIFVLCMTCASAWAQEYRPLLEEGKTWTVAGVHATWAGSPFRGYGQYNIYTLRGVDTVDGKAWRQLFCYNMDEQGNKSAESRVALLREENGKVSFYDTKDRTEKLLMDINAEKGDVLNVAERAVSRWNDEANRTLEGVSVQEVSTYNYGDNTLKKLRLKWTEGGTDESQPYEFSWVEGVGAVGQEPFNNDPIGLTATFVPHLADCQVDGDVLYRDEDIYAYMQQTLPTEFPGAEGYRPLLEEGKTWRVAWLHANIAYSDVYDYIVMGDTVVGNHTWKKIYCTCHANLKDGTRNAYLSVPSHVMREEGGRVYFLKDRNDQEGTLLMDTDWKVGDVWHPYISTDNFLGEKTSDEATYDLCVSTIGNTDSGGRTVRTWTLAYSNESALEEYGYQPPRLTWIEGVGEIHRGLSNDEMNHLYMDSRGCRLMECHVGDEVLYSYPIPEIDDLMSRISTPIVTDRSDSSTLHDLQGRRLTAEPQHGVFIRDGKKVMR